ncbi:MAG: MMPL family transporter [Verrucomicrobiae bacterium]|nr:MMPL family transporter [Verrucomicrobiae bacterium]
MPWFLERGRTPFLIVLGGITLFLGFHCLHLKVDQDNRSMDADNAEQKAIESEFRQVFHENDAIFVAVSGTKLLEGDGPALIRDLVDQFAALKGVRRVSSLVDSDFIVSPYQNGLLISEDESMTGIRLVLEEFTDNGETLTGIIESVESIAAAHSNDATRIAVTGLPVQKYEVGKLVRRDQRMFAPLSLLILGGVLLFITRRFSGMVFPLLVSVITICWTLGIYSWMGHTLNMITSLLPPVIMTLSVATTIHIYLDWLRSTEEDRFRRITGAVRHLYKPCLFASLTTAIGFLSLLLSHTPAVRHFGIFAALGVGISYFLGVIGLAVGLSFLKPPHSDHFHTTQSGSFLDRLLQATGNLSVNHPWKIVILTFLVTAVGVIGFQRIESDTDLLHFLGDDSALVQDTEFIDQHLAGVSTIELLVKKADGTPMESTAPIASFQGALGKIAHVRHTLSLADLLPEEAIAAQENGIPLADIVAGVDVSEYLSDDLEKLRITVSTDSIGTQKGTALVDALRDTARTTLGDAFVVQPVGGFYRVIVESNQLVISQVKSFAIALALILLAIGIVFRSFVYTLLAIVPNVVPLLLTAAVMGFTGIALSTGTAMIASVVIGIAVDDTIHYLAAYRRTVRHHRNEAIRHTTRSTGFVLLSTTMALSAGFWVALFGSFQPTIYFAFLTGMTMWFALVCDLLVLPAFLRLASPNERAHQTPATP